MFRAINAFFNRKKVLWFTAGSMIRQLVSFIMLPIYTSYLTPKDYGILSLLAVTMSLYELFLAAQFGRALPKFYYDADSRVAKDSVIITAFGLTLPITLIGVAAFAGSAPWISEHILEQPDITHVVMLYGLTLMTTTIEAYVMILFRLKEHTALFFFNSLGKLAVQLSLNIYTVVVLDMGLVGVLYSTIIASAAFALLSLIYTGMVCKIRFDKSLVKPLFSFTWPLWIAGMGNVFVTSASQLIIKEAASVADVGLFQLAGKFAAIINLVIWMPFMQWWSTERFKILKEPDRMFEFTHVFSTIHYVMLLAAGGISFLSPVVMKYMVGEAFYPAAVLIPVKCFHLVVLHLAQMHYVAFLSASKTKVLANLSWLNAITMLIFLPALTFPFGIEGAVYAYLLSAVVTLLVTAYLAKKEMPLGFQLPKHLMILTLVFSFVTAVSYYLNISTPITMLATEVAVITVILIAVVSAAILTDRSLIRFLWKGLKN